jgi:hypothetical protein
LGHFQGISTVAVGAIACHSLPFADGNGAKQLIPSGVIFSGVLLDRRRIRQERAIPSSRCTDEWGSRCGMSKDSADIRDERDGGGVDDGAPPGAPAWVTPALIAQTIKTWQPYYETRLTPDDALAMILNVGRLFDVLSRPLRP